MFAVFKRSTIWVGLLLTACGGGGGGGPTPPPTPQAQTIAFADAGPLYKFSGNSAFANLASGGGGSGAITYTSDTPAVATVDAASGQVTIVGTGVANITASKAADTRYLAAQASYELRVAVRDVAVTAWVGTADTQIDLAPLSDPLHIAHSTDLSCDPANVAACQNGAEVQTSATTMVDATATQSQSSIYWLKHGPIASAGITIPAYMFRDNLVSGVVGANGRLWVLTSNPRINGDDDVWSSADGANWTQEATSVLGIQQIYVHFLYVNNAFWVISDDNSNLLWHSSDGKTWTELPAPAFPPRSGFTVAAFNGCLWILGGSSGGQIMNELWSSADGLTWIENNAAVFPQARERTSLTAHQGRLWAAAGDNGFGTYDADVWSSPDGAAWTQATANAGFAPRSGSYLMSDGTKLLLAGGGNFNTPQFSDVWTSTDGIHWSLTSTPHISLQNSDGAATYWNGAFWMVHGSDSEVWRSPTGADWTKTSPDARIPDQSAIAATGFQGKLWVVGFWSQLYSSSDGINWSAASTAVPGPIDFEQLAGLPDRLLLIVSARQAVTPHHEVWQTTDGSQWTQVSASTPFNLNDALRVARFGGKVWVFGVNSADPTVEEVWWTTDGASWTQATATPAFAPLSGYQVIAYANKLYAVGGYRDAVPVGAAVNEVWESADGVTWTLLPASATLPQQIFQTSFALSDKMCVSISNGVGGPSTLWCSPDGINWSVATSVAPLGVVAQVNGWTYMIGSGPVPYYSNDFVWRSSDGISWRLGYQNVFHFP
jgi:hypothetical protein